MHAYQVGCSQKPASVFQVKIAYINFLNHCYVDTEVEMKEIYTSNHMWKLFENFLVDICRVRLSGAAGRQRVCVWSVCPRVRVSERPRVDVRKHLAHPCHKEAMRPSSLRTPRSSLPFPRRIEFTHQAPGKTGCFRFSFHPLRIDL